MDKIIEKWDEILNTVKKEYEISDVCKNVSAKIS